MRKDLKKVSSLDSDSQIGLLIWIRVVSLPRPLPTHSATVKHSYGVRTLLMASGLSDAERNLKVEPRVTMST